MMEPRKIALYLRISTGEQNFNSQEAELERYCESQGWRVDQLAVFKEIVSGAAKRRPIFDGLIKKARAGLISKVVVWKMDRLGRSMENFVWAIAELERLKIPIVSITEGIDTSSSNATSQFQVNILASVSSLFRSQLIERVRAGMSAAKARGKKFGRPRIVTAEIEAQARDLRAKGWSCAAIGNRLGISESAATRATRGVDHPPVVRKTRARFGRNPPPKTLPANQASLSL